MFALLAVGVAAVVVCGWLVFDSAAQLADHSKRQTTATEYALTLTRLATKIDQSQSGQFAPSLNGDSIARLIAMGDVQTGELLVTAGSGLLIQPEISELSAGGEAIAQKWSVIRNQISALNTEAITGEGERINSVTGTAIIDSLGQSFETLFIAITNETLSVPLLRIVSQIKAEISNLLFLSGLPGSVGLNETTNKALGGLLQSVAALQQQAFGEQGLSVLGYESNLLLQSFVEQVAELRPVTSATAIDNQSVSSLNVEVYGPALQDQIIIALDQNEVYRRALDGAIYQYRRSILGALACVCAALLLLAMLTWRLWRVKLSPVVQPTAGLSVMVADINALADGNLAVEVRSPEGESDSAVQSRMIAQAVNYTGKMLHGLAEASRGVAVRTHAVSVEQHQIAEELIEADLERQRQLVLLIDSIKVRIPELLDLSETKAAATNELAAAALDTRHAANNATAVLAGVSAQVELGVSRMSRAVETVGELTTMVDKMKAVAEKSSLQALNTSIQMSAYSDEGDSDVSPQFVDQVQRASRHLESGATEAGRLLEIIKTDLHASGVAMTSCSVAIDDSADASMKASQSFASITSGVEGIGESNAHLVDELKKEAENLNQITDKLCHLFESTIDKNRLPQLLESTLDLQLMATNFDESLSRYQLKREQPVD